MNGETGSALAPEQRPHHGSEPSPGGARAKRALTPRLLAAFFAFATAMCTLAGLSLLAPAGPLAAIWRVKPDEFRQLIALGPAVGIGFLAHAAVMASASCGTARRRRWGWRLAVAIFALNALADAARIPFGAVAEGMIGVAAAAVILWWLTRRDVKRQFGR